jgi:hypothetical protein
MVRHGCGNPIIVDPPAAARPLTLQQPARNRAEPPASAVHDLEPRPRERRVARNC